METRIIPGVTLPVSRIVLGTMIINRGCQEQSNTLLDAALALGVNTFDTAHVYGGGDTERAIGVWLAQRGNRERVVLLAKGCHHNGDRQRVTSYDIGADLLDTLARFQTSYVDMWMLHRDDVSQPVGPLVEALNEHLRAGRICAFGGSNWTHQRLAEANAYAAAKGLTGMAVSSPNFGLAEQVQDPWGPGCVTISGPQNAAARAWYAQTGTSIFAYSSLARGLFSGRVQRASRAVDIAKLDDAARTAYCHPVNFARLDRCLDLAAQKGLTVPQIATAWTLSQALPVHALVGAATPAELENTVAGAAVQLTPAECAWLDTGVESAAAR